MNPAYLLGSAQADRAFGTDIGLYIFLAGISIVALMVAWDRHSENAKLLSLWALANISHGIKRLLRWLTPRAMAPILGVSAHKLRGSLDELARRPFSRVTGR